ncbi:hypothetical protein ADIARSV_2972 [Arcticibacter svalbardensis MN12-7]|uniref:Uncharacterized protein n=2 Tax=Arcticibacter TaxID=1288026 RepID=R9GQL7_9SPHI|nr:hypothetical protein ADIARSV_2972 [Arcticibacter svalbardensis MN12-7]
MKLLVILMIFYLYALTYGVFMTEIFRIPAPLLFCFPLIILYKEKSDHFYYWKELFVLIASVFCYYIIGSSDYRTFIATFISMVICVCYFNYFVNTNKSRFNYSILIFYLLLTFSAVVMVLNHFYPQMNNVRELIMNEMVLQSPSGIAISQFTFGYQLAALVSFAVIYTIVFHQPFYIKIFVFLTCLLFIYLGMQRSVFITFACSITLFSLLYYRYKAIFIIGIAICTSLLFYNYVLKDSSDNKNNILSKNENNDPEFNRSGLVAENLRIYADYPLGLVFYGKSWGDVIYRNRVFSSGITSHNAYLMFITYLGPFLGLALLLAVYSKIVRIGFAALKQIRLKENAMLICLCFSFLAISINALSHNAWLISADGPTLFLYISILHLNKIMPLEKEQAKLEI